MKQQLFIANLDYSVDESDLFSLLESIGALRSVKLARDPEGRSRGFAFAEFIDTQDIERAIAQLNNYTWRGRPLRVDRAAAREHKRHAKF